MRPEPKGLSELGMRDTVVQSETQYPANISDRVGESRCPDTEHGNMAQLIGEGRLVSDGGLLQIAWPRRVADGSAVPLDFLLATATRPTLTGEPLAYPAVEMIANAWNADAGNHVEYFWKNIDNGIRTFQDDEIRALLRARGAQAPSAFRTT